MKEGGENTLSKKIEKETSVSVVEICLQQEVFSVACFLYVGTDLNVILSP